MKAKYIIIENMEMEYPIVFNPILKHDIFSSFKIVSAGFCQRDADDKFVVWGKSISLKLNSRPEDADILNKFLEIEL